MSASDGLKATAVTVRRGRRAVLTTVDCQVRPGELVVLVGPNGAGKSTLLRAMSGLLAVHAGAIRLDGEPLQSIAPAERGRRLGYLPQNGECAWPLTVERLVALGRLPHQAPWRRPQAADARAIEAALAACELEPLRQRPVTTLSGGERARVMLARALAAEPSILLADEPVASLDPYHQLHLMDLLRGAVDRGMGVLVVLHDLTLAARYGDRISVLQDGSVVAAGGIAEVLCPAVLGPVYGVGFDIARVAGHTVLLPRQPQRPAPAL